MTNQPNNNTLTLPVNAKIDLEIDNEQKLALASLTNAGDFEDNIFFTYTIISGDAVFNSENDKTVTVQANPANVAAASFLSNSTTRGTIEVHPTVNAKLTTSADYSITGTEPQYLITLSASSPTAIADGISSDSVTAILKDKIKNDIDNKELQFTIADDSGATFDNNSSSIIKNTNKNGQATALVKLKSNKDKTVDVRCNLLSENSIKQDTKILFKGYEPPQPSKQMFISLDVVNNDKATSNGQDQIVINASLTDEKKNPISNKKIIFNIENNNNHITIDTKNNGITSSSGVATAIFTDGSQKSESYVVLVYLNDDNSINNNTTIAFKATAPRPAPTSPPTQAPTPAPTAAPRIPHVNIRNARYGSVQKVAPFNYSRADTARTEILITDQHGHPMSGKAVFISVYSLQLAVTRIVGIQGDAINPVTTYTANTDINGNIQVNIAQWRASNYIDPGARIYVNFNSYNNQGPYIDIPFYL